MTDELDTLRPEVREAVAAIDKGNGVFVNGDDYEGGIAWATVRADLLRLVRDNDALRSKCNVIMSGSTRHLGRAERAEAELAALKVRIAEAPAAVVQGAPGAIKASFHGYGCFEYAAENLQSKLRGKRVRLVVEE